MRVFICVPYAGEPEELLLETLQSTLEYRQAGLCLQEDTERSLPKTLNACAQKAIGEGATHIMWLSTGDTLRPGRLQTPPPEDKAQFCLACLNGGRSYPDPENYEPRSVYTDNQFCLSGAIVPVHIWQAVGGLDETLTYCSDWDLAMRIEYSYGWEMMPIVYVDAWEYEGGLTKGADLKLRQRDRSRVKGRAVRMRKGVA